MSTFCIGQKIVCVTDAFTDSAGQSAKVFPKYGEIYTVRGVREFADGVPGILLEELQNDPTAIRIVDPVAPEQIEPSWFAWRFRPVLDETAETVGNAARSTDEKRPEYA
jgi:hypothetical protein